MNRLHYLVFDRNLKILKEEEQRKLLESKVTVIGYGGIGGIALELLVRSGVGELLVVDNGSFEITNLNRQMCTFEDLGKEKVKIAVSRAKKINPQLRIKGVLKEVNERNIYGFLEDSDAVVDGLDGALSRVILSRGANRVGIPYFFGAAERERGMSTLFMPKGASYEGVFNLPSRGKKLSGKINKILDSYQRCDAILGVVSNLVGCFEALQCVKFLIGRRDLIKAPKFLYIDAFSEDLVRVVKI